MGLTRDVFKHTSIYSIASILGRLTSFLMLPFYAHIFETEGYGVLGMIDASVSVLAIVFASGFHTAIVRTYHEIGEEQRPKIFSTAIWLLWAGCLVTIPPLMLLSPWLSSLLLGTSKYWVLIVLSLASLAIDVAGKSASVHLVIDQRSILLSSVGLLSLFINIGLNILLVVVLQVGLIGIFISSLVTVSISTAILVTFAFRELGAKFDRDLAARLCRFQLPLIPGEIFAFISRQAERYLVRFMISLEGVGILEMGYKFAPLLGLFFTSPFMLTWRPKSIEMAQRSGASETMGRMLTAYLYPLMLGGALLAVNIKAVLMLLTPPDFWSAARIARFEIVTTILGAGTTYMQFGLIYYKRTKEMALIKTAVAGVKIFVSVVCIRALGLAGAALSACVMEGVMLTWITLRSQSLFHIRIEYRRLALSAAAIFGVVMALSELDYSRVGAAGAFADHVAPWFISMLGHTPLHSWKNGKLLLLLDANRYAFASLVFNTLAVLALGLTLIGTHPAARRMLVERFRRGKTAAPDVTPAI